MNEGLCVFGPRDGDIVACAADTYRAPDLVARASLPVGPSYVVDEQLPEVTYVYHKMYYSDGTIGLWLPEDKSVLACLQQIFTIYARHGSTR